MPNTNFQTVHQFGAGISQVVRQATGRDPVHNIEMEHVTVAQNKRGYPVQSYMGNPLTFAGEKPGYLGSVLLEMFVRQNLNGYDYPWPAGGGNNMFNPATVVEGSYYIASETGVTVNIDRPGDQWIASGFIPVTPGDVLYFGEVHASATRAGSAFYNENMEYIDGFSATRLYNNSQIWTVPANAAYLRHSFKSTVNPNWQTAVYIIKNSDPHTFTPYENICPIPSRNDIAVLIDRNGEREVYTSDFPAPGVYAGTFNMATGVLTSTWAALPVSVLEWQRTTGSDTPRMYAAVPNMLNDVSHRFQIYTTHFRTITDTSVTVPDLPMYSIYAAGGGSENVYVRVPDDMTVEQFEQTFADAMIVYPVNVPDISQLPKHVIPTAIGTNTIATDADLLEVTLYYLGDI